MEQFKDTHATLAKKVRFADDQLRHFHGAYTEWKKKLDEHEKAAKLQGFFKGKQKERVNQLIIHLKFAKDSIEYWKYMRKAWYEERSKLAEDEFVPENQTNLFKHEQSKGKGNAAQEK